MSMNRTYISESINDWIYETYRKYRVNIYRFCYEWAHWYYNNHEVWPKGHKRKSEDYDRRETLEKWGLSSLIWDYDYKQKSNLFGIDLLYRNMPKKRFIKGRKQELEAIIMYCWLHGVTSDNDYWEEYSQNVL